MVSNLSCRYAAAVARLDALEALHLDENQLTGVPWQLGEGLAASLKAGASTPLVVFIRSTLKASHASLRYLHVLRT